MSRMQLRVVQGDPDDPAIAQNVPDRDRAAMILAGLVELAREDVQRNGWDAPLALGLLYQRARTPVGSPTRAGIIEWRQVPGADATLQRYDQPHLAIVNWAYHLRQRPEGPREDVPVELIGLALLSEGWTVAVPWDDPQAVKDMKRVARERGLQEHDDRVEVKIVTGVDIDGVRYGVMHPREAGRLPDSATRSAGVFEVNRHGVTGGNIMTALHYAVLALLGRTLPDWEQFSELHDYPADAGESP